MKEMIKIMAPLNETCDLDNMFSLADEYYVGASDDEWFFNTNDYISYNTRGYRNSDTCFHRKKLAEVLKKASANGKKVFLTANTHNIDKEKLPVVKQIIREFAKNGGSGVICSELNCLSYAKEEGIEAVLSTNMAVYNLKSLDYLCKHYEVDRLILSRDMTMDEIKEFRKSTDLELEVFGLNFGCRFSNGHCTGTHNHRTGGFCSAIGDMIWEYTGINGERLNEKMIFSAKINHHIFMEYFMRTACGLCALYTLNEAGINSFKIVGRELDGKRIEKDTRLVNRCRDLIKECSDREEFSKKIEPLIKKHGIENCLCGFGCYYPEERGELIF